MDKQVIFIHQSTIGPKWERRSSRHCMTDESPMLKRKPDTKGHILYDPTIARLFESLEIDWNYLGQCIATNRGDNFSGYTVSLGV